MRRCYARVGFAAALAGDLAAAAVPILAFKAP